MHAWVTGIMTKSPSTAIGKFLRLQERKTEVQQDKALDFSDVIVFDFLVDGIGILLFSFFFLVSLFK